MALRSGYKGFKKLLPGLKLFRPGTLGIDNDVLIPELNKTFFPRSEQAVLGAKNIFDYVNVDKAPSNTSYEFITGGFNIKSSNDSWASLSCFIPNKYKNKDMDFVCDLDYISGRVQINVYHNSTPTSSGATVISNSGATTSDGKLKVSFNSGDDNYLIIRFFVTLDTAAVGESNFTNMMLKFSDFNDDFAPYAMTNRELTVAITPINGIELVELANGIGGSISGESYLYKFGKLVVAYIQLLGITASMNDYIMTLPEDYRPRKIINVVTKKAGDDNLHLGQVMSNGNVQISFAISNANYTLLATSWVTK